MEDLTAALAGSFEISNDPNKTSAPHPRYAQFKSKTPKQDQDSRRRRLLEIQKKNRFNFINHVRKLTEDDWKDEEDEDENAENDSGKEVEVKVKRPGRYYKDQLMLSEWLVEIPEDFTQEWACVVCPVGRRSLVVTNRKTTKAYAKNGHCIRSFPSHLPGGCRRMNKQSHSTILDCVYNELEKTYYVLDMMCWNGHSIYETETEFRFYWLHDKFSEMGTALAQVSKINPFKFVPLPSFACTSEAISSAMAAANFEIDGLLFYHKRTHYLFGSSPLVVWLKPYMVPEILGISVPDQHLGHRPANYTNYAQHMQQVGEDKTKDTDVTRRDYKAYGHTKRHSGAGNRHSKGGNDHEMEEEGGRGEEGGEVSTVGDMESQVVSTTDQSTPT